MKTQIRLFTFFSFFILISCGSDRTKTETSKEKPDNDPSFQANNLEEQVLYNRAFNAVVWGMPAVNFELLHESLINAKGDFNQIVYWSGLIKL